MAYAAYKEFSQPIAKEQPALSNVIDITVPLANAACLRRALQACDDVNVLHCEPLLRPRAACLDSNPRARFSVLLSTGRLGDVSSLVLACTEDGELGALMSWREHLTRRGMAHGG